MKIRTVLALLLLFVTLAAFRHLSNVNEVPIIKARRATDFLNSIGVNSSISKRGELLPKTAEALSYTGIRWIRAGYEGDIPMADFIALHRQTGVKYSYGLLSGGTDIKRLLTDGHKLAAAGALLAFEGPNEPNNWGFTYKGKQGGKNNSWFAVANLQRDLYNAVKSDKALKRYPVFNLSESGAQTDNMGLQYLTIPANAGTRMPAGTRYADYVNCHNYIVHPSWPGLHDNQTWNAASPGGDTRVDGLIGNYGSTWGKQFKGHDTVALKTLPRVTTETGLTIGDGVTEDQHGKLLLNMYLAQFTRGWSYTAVYLLRDRSDEAGNQQFGFYKTDYTPRKAAIYLHNLSTILADNGHLDKVSALSYKIFNRTRTVHDLLLQKSDGSLMLILWNERVQGADEVTVKLMGYPENIEIFDPILGTKAIRAESQVSNFMIKLSDHPVIVHLRK